MEQLVGSLCKRHAVAGHPAPTACKRTVSGTISLPCSGFFSPFPHGTGSLSVFGSYLALRDGPRGFRQDSSCPALLRWPLCHMILARTRLSLSTVRLSRRFRFGHVPTARLLQPPSCLNNPGLGSFRFARHYFGNRYFLSLPAGTKMFQFPAFALAMPVTGLQPDGFPHSEISGSIPVCKYPELIAAYHVLRRLRKPRHPPSALVLFL